MGTTTSPRQQLKPKLETVDGSSDNERFRSQRTEGRLLSLSTWRDEKAVVRWRTHGEHHYVQQKGRSRCWCSPVIGSRARRARAPSLQRAGLGHRVAVEDRNTMRKE